MPLLLTLWTTSVESSAIQGNFSEKKREKQTQDSPKVTASKKNSSLNVKLKKHGCEEDWKQGKELKGDTVLGSKLWEALLVGKKR